MDNVKVQNFLRSIQHKKVKRNKVFKKFWTYNKYTLYKYERCVKTTDIIKDKAQVILFKRLFLT